MNETQKIILNIYIEIKKICERHSIPFFAIGGTCIGAVRHNGFIPWDDDLDIAVPIQHFDKLLELCKNELPDNLKVYRCDDIRHYRYIFAKIHDINTTAIEKCEINYPDAHKGIWVDIMPISSFPDNDNKKNIFSKKLGLYLKMNFIRRYPFSEMDSWKKRIIWLLIRPLCIFTNYSYYSDKWIKMLRNYPLGCSNVTGYTWWNYSDNLVFPMDCFKSAVNIDFESTTIPCPVGYDAYLTIQFGDYMKIPPKSEQQQHNLEILNTSESYTNHLNNSRQI